EDLVVPGRAVAAVEDLHRGDLARLVGGQGLEAVVAGAEGALGGAQVPAAEGIDEHAVPRRRVRAAVGAGGAAGGVQAAGLAVQAAGGRQRGRVGGVLQLGATAHHLAQVEGQREEGEHGRDADGHEGDHRPALRLSPGSLHRAPHFTSSLVTMETTAGPSTTDISDGRMQSTRGKVIFTPTMAAWRSASCMRRTRMPSACRRRARAMLVPNTSVWA